MINLEGFAGHVDMELGCCAKKQAPEQAETHGKKKTCRGLKHFGLLSRQHTLFFLDPGVVHVVLGLRIGHRLSARPSKACLIASLGVGLWSGESL